MQTTIIILNANNENETHANLIATGVTAVRNSRILHLIALHSFLIEKNGFLTRRIDVFLDGRNTDDSCRSLRKLRDNNDFEV